jgi:hypothetical protein
MKWKWGVAQTSWVMDIHSCKMFCLVFCLTSRIVLFYIFEFVTGKVKTKIINKSCTSLWWNQHCSLRSVQLLTSSATRSCPLCSVLLIAQSREDYKQVNERVYGFTQNYWVFGPRPSSGILKTRKHNVSETGSVSVLMWGGDTYSVGSLIKS